MADIEAYLKETYNGPAPQHKLPNKDQFEVSEGSDGAPHSKIVDKDGKPIDPRDVNFPADYPDLTANERLEAIEQTQGQIITALQATNESLLATNDHLSSVIKDDRLQSDTQLIGSIVEHYFKPNVTVTPGSSYFVSDIIFKSRQVSLGIQFESPKASEVVVISRSPDGSMYFEALVLEPLSRTGRRTAYEFTLKAMNTDIRIDNTDTEDLIIKDVIVVEGG